MPSSSRLTELCRYHYDPLDRQAGCTLTLVQPATLQRYYCKSRLATEVQGAVRTSLFQHDDQLLAQQRQQNDKVDTTLLATDQQRSVLSALDTTRPHPLAYTPYGYRPAENGLLSLLGFNGEQPDPITGCYHLGNGYRQFNPVLMRFNSPDSWSPFGEGGLNAYAYVKGDPRNKIDPDGHKGIASLIKGIANRLKLRTPSRLEPDNTTAIKLGAELKYKGKVYLKNQPAPELRDATPNPIDFTKASKKSIAQHIDFFDGNNQLLADRLKLNNPFENLLGQTRLSVNNRWRPTFLPSVNRSSLMGSLADSVETYRALMSKVTPDTDIVPTYITKPPSPVIRRVRRS